MKNGVIALLFLEHKDSGAVSFIYTVICGEITVADLFGFRMYGLKLQQAILIKTALWSAFFNF